MSTSSRLRSLLGAAAAALLGGGLLVAGAAPASAHATLVSVSPRDGTTLTSAPREVELVFDEPVSQRFTSVVITGPDGADVTGGPARVQGSHVSAPLTPGLGSGEYRVAFRVVSDDGHPVLGQSRFTLRLAAEPSPTTGGGSPAASRTAAATAPVGAPTSLAGEGGEPWLTAHLPVLSGALLLLVVGAGALLWDRRRG